MDASSHMDRRSAGLTRGTALTFVILLGVVSLFADMTYEGARSITVPYLAVLGASATVAGIVAGFGELTGYVIRYASLRDWHCAVGYAVLSACLLAVSRGDRADRGRLCRFSAHRLSFSKDLPGVRRMDTPLLRSRHGRGRRSGPSVWAAV